MATTNLISKSLGNILVESGNGLPDHVSPKGSSYVDQDTATLYINQDGNVAWNALKTVAYGEVFYQDNTTQTTISSIDVWTAVGNTFTEGDVNGFSASTDTMVVEAGRAGKYQIVGNATLDYVGGTNNFEVGISINSAIPIAGAFNGGALAATYTKANIDINVIIDLSDDDTIELAVRNKDQTNNVIILHGQIFAIKMD